LVADADAKRSAAGAGWFVTTDYRVYSMLRWHLKDAVPVVQLNERARYIGFHQPRLEGPVGLYVAPDGHRNTALWNETGAVRQTVESADLVWRGFRYDVYTFQRLTGWTLAQSLAPDDPLFVARPN